MELSGHLERFFTAPLKKFGGKSRLQIWKEKGFARKRGRPWFIQVGVLIDDSMEAESQEDLSVDEDRSGGPSRFPARGELDCGEASIASIVHTLEQEGLAA
jgi:hypothetical protein